MYINEYRELNVRENSEENKQRERFTKLSSNWFSRGHFTRIARRVTEGGIHFRKLITRRWESLERNKQKNQKISTLSGRKCSCKDSEENKMRKNIRGN